MPDAPASVFAGIALGRSAEIVRTLTEQDLILAAHASGDRNPIHMPAADKDGDGAPDQDAEAPALWMFGALAALIGQSLPGPGARCLSWRLAFHGPLRVGEAARVRVEVAAKTPPDRLLLACRIVRDRDGAVLADGEALVAAPAAALPPGAAGPLPGLTVRTHPHVAQILAACAGLAPLRTAVVAPESSAALAGALSAAARGLIAPILIGDPARIAAAAEALRADIAPFPLIPAPDHAAAAAEAVAQARAGAADAVMKGDLHTDELLRHVVKAEGGLRGARRLSHVFVFDVPGRARLLHVSDAAIAIAPTLEEKADIVQNAIDLARALGEAQPRVGILSAVETVNPKIPSTLDAAALAKMAERGQIRGGLVDGPLAMDNAVDPAAAKAKGIVSAVAGRADVLIVPNIEAGNILVKELGFVSGAEGAGLVVGAKVPVILTSRADDETSRLLSCAIAVLYAHWRLTGESPLQSA